MTPEHRIEWLSDHLKDVSSRQYSHRPRFSFDDLRLVFEMGMEAGRHDAIIDFAKHVDDLFLQGAQPTENL